MLRPSFHPPCSTATLEVDALHLCYLALELWLFRNRIALRYLRNGWALWRCTGAHLGSVHCSQRSRVVPCT